MFIPLDSEQKKLLVSSGKRIIIATPNEPDGYYAYYYQEIDRIELSRILGYRDRIYEDSEDFINDYIEYEWEDDVNLPDAEQEELLKEKAANLWDDNSEEIVLITVSYATLPDVTDI